MNDMSKVIIARSDQMNSDDLLGGPITIEITKMSVRPDTEQPVSVHYKGDDNKPFKPCKSMCRVMIAAWGADANKYVGKRMTLYRDDKVKWGGMEVGGIRISHMSDIDGPLIMALTATRGSKKAYTVQPLSIQSASKKPEATTEQKTEAAKKKADTIIALIGKTHNLKELEEVLDANSASIARIKEGYVDLNGLINDAIILRREFFDTEVGGQPTDNEELPI